MLSLKSLIEEEVTRCTSFLQTASPMKLMSRMPISWFVARSLKLHWNLIERWQGPEFVGRPVLIQDESHGRDCAALEYQQMQANLGKRADFRFKVGAYQYNRWTGGIRLCPREGSSAQDANVLMHRTIQERYPNLGPLLKKKKKYNLMIGYLYTQDPTKGSGYVQGALEGEARVGQRTSVCFERILDTHKIAERYPPLVEEYAKLFQRLGETTWGAKEIPVAVTFSVRPSHFLRLGHYTENDSCYRNGSLHESCKFYLSADIPDSFIILSFRGKKATMERNNDDPQGRAWGIAVPGKGAVVTNFYTLTYDAIKPAIIPTCQEAFGVEKLRTYSSQVLRVRDHNSAFYTNADVTYLSGPTVFRSKFVDHHLSKVLEYSQEWGKYTHNGAGPFSPPPRVLALPTVWPYKDVTLLEAL